jgi:hypothetical protein
MLAGTLAAALYRELTKANSSGAVWLLAKLFVFVAIIECSAGVITETVSDSSGSASALANGMRTAVATVTLAAVLMAVQQFARRLVPLPAHEVPSRWHVGKI